MGMDRPCEMAVWPPAVYGQGRGTLMNSTESCEQEPEPVRSPSIAETGIG